MLNKEVIEIEYVYFVLYTCGMQTGVVYRLNVSYRLGVANGYCPMLCLGRPFIGQSFRTSPQSADGGGWIIEGQEVVSAGSGPIRQLPILLYGPYRRLRGCVLHISYGFIAPGYWSSG